MQIWQNGEWRPLAGESQLLGTPALQFGFGLFETILIQRQRPLHFAAHLRRLEQSLDALNASGRTDLEQMQETAQQAAQACIGEKAVLKIIVCQEAAQWRWHLFTRPYPYTKQHYEQGFSLKQSAVRRSASSTVIYHKTLNYLENSLERQKAIAAGYDDAFFLNTEGLVTECTCANLFILRGTELLTSPVAAGLLPGISRAKVLETASCCNVTPKELPLNQEMLKTADAVFVSNALCGIMPVTRIEEKRYPPAEPLVRQLHRLLGILPAP